MTRRLFLILLGALTATRLAEARSACSDGRPLGTTPANGSVPGTPDGWMLRYDDR